MAATSEVPSTIPSDQSPALAGQGARRMAPEERVAALMDGLHSILENAVESPSHWQVLLDASANLWRYSGGNVALLMMQMAQRGTDEPTLVAGYKEWERRGRTVLRGEHALWVIAPRTTRVQQLLLPDGIRQRVPVGSKLPSGAVDEGKKTLITGWRGQAVFDVSQTQGAPLLVPRPGNSSVEAPQLWASLAGVARSHGFSINVTDAQYGLTSGFTDFGQRQVQVGGWLNAEERIAVLAHELGHVLLHGPDDNVGKLYGSSVDHRGLAEVEAESVAYTVLKAHGIDRGPQTASYLSGWADAVIAAEHSATGDGSSRNQPASRVDIAKSVLGRVTAAAKQILEVTDPPGLGGKVTAAEISPMVSNPDTYAGLKQPGEPSRGLEISGP
ncbi:ArdC-like ssDNA-binding domain-containing protein [Arthrobacter bambusae]|uniref:Antirestriction protein ArdC n=1 Tax=Arthrobacter bambusae TaxID=1338426 RepID=A0AAW8DJR3_9MICC|nr:ArdC-like ssDNA-binding domain-containing protein [Arthrobacter bambusae]MDP9906061.1 antirestriction protein ArdC [Arthrobacter bambusae]MDQ0131144.1 antirestriction protein ArdC [Arthrobacter bambusae]MDQ0181864.1 antirestriction protein ArdC [Arthrobacter bambusae]